MPIVYVYVLDTLADWEIGYVTAELNSGRFFKKGAECVSLKYVGCSEKAVTTMGGVTIEPDCVVEDIVLDATSVLLLPGADTWNDSIHGAVIEKAKELLDAGATVCAICGATTALANAGILDKRAHTSNGAGFLEMFAPGYHGQDFYVDDLAVADQNLITAGAAGALLWTKQILARMDVFKPKALEAWYAYFHTGDSKYFFQLMQEVGK